jgi:DNA-directed RNA polymerase subunit RPC12/RpoP
MPSEAIRCSDCGATFKGVPSWLITAKVKFTCTNCPKRPSRAVARFDPPIVTAAVLDPEADLDAVEIDEVDEEADLDIGADELEDVKDEKDL